MMRIPSSGNWSASAHTWANTVSWPCPELVEPTKTSRIPSATSRMLAVSFAPPALLSTNDANPMPWHRPSIVRPWMDGFSAQPISFSACSNTALKSPEVELCRCLVGDKPPMLKGISCE